MAANDHNNHVTNWCSLQINEAYIVIRAIVDLMNVRPYSNLTTNGG